MKTILFKTNDQQSVEKLAEYLGFLNTERHPDKQVEYIIEIKLNRPVRSVKANRFYRAILMCIAPYAGYTEDELHEYYKKRFNGKHVLEELIGQSTSNMDTLEFSNYVKKVKEHGEKFFGAVIKDPRDKDYGVWEQLTKQRYDDMFSHI